MSTQMKTPGVYIKERNAFPNSAVEAPTAIPAFIGYTEKAGTNNEYKDRLVRIQSFNEFREIFGGYPEYKFNLLIDKDKKIYEIENLANFNFYNQINLFFTNGGGVCYIVSVGNYNDEIAENKLSGALKLLEYEDEPTLITIPEAAFLSEVDLNSINQKILVHCEKMKFRFGILDTVMSSEGKFDNSYIVNFREGIGNKSLRFGAAYFPWLKTNVMNGNVLNYKNIRINSFNLIKYINDHYIVENNIEIKGEIARLISDQNNIYTIVDNFSSFPNDIYGELKKYVGNSSKLKRIEAYQKSLIQNIINGLIVELDEAKAALKTLSDVTDIAIREEENAKTVVSNAKTLADEKSVYLKEAEAKNLPQVDLEELEKGLNDAIEAVTLAEKDLDDKTEIVKTAAAAQAILASEYNHKNSFDYIKAKLEFLIDETTVHKTLYNHLPFYKEVFTKIEQKLNTLPPSTAIAGLYTYVDTNMGVWKSPANVSLSGVVAPLIILNNDEQADLNMPINGKSINAIRSFKNVGIKVWGARTLDGNSQDWRYINVKRTMMMIQSTIKSTCNAYIFEANDANTWVSIRSVINNYLHSVWKRGGLAGSTPEDAFSVSIGLGETMTPNDILDGILRIEILVAMVRPAEFIEITFQQQMQKS